MRNALIVLAVMVVDVAVMYLIWRYKYPKPRRNRRVVWWLQLRNERLRIINRWRFFIKPDLKKRWKGWQSHE